MRARFAIAALLLAAALPASAQTSARTAPRRPNFVFIISDDHRWDGLGAAGNKTIVTPTLDRLAREGAYFRQATVVVAQCTPSRAALLTGLPPHANGIYSIQSQREDLWYKDQLATTTMPALLSEAGYRTMLIGKWHLAAVPWKAGFTDVGIWLEEGIAAYANARLARGKVRGRTRMTGFTNEIFRDDAIAFLNSSDAGTKPFLLWLALTAPHTPTRPNPEYVTSLYAGKTSAELVPPTFPPGATPEDFVPYNEAVSLVDEITRRVLETLQQRGLDSNTIVVFLGDNGYMMGSHGMGGKIVPYEESIRVPLLVRMPGTTGLRGTSNAAVSSLDLPPTFLGLAGVRVPAGWAGRDLSTYLRTGAAAAAPAYAVSEWADNESWFAPMAHRLVRSSEWKLVRWEHSGKPEELYDLTKDPHETNNLAANPAFRAKRAELSGQLGQWMTKTRDPARLWPKDGLPLRASGDTALDIAGARARAVRVDTSVLDMYVGTYEMVNRGILPIERRGDRLWSAGDDGAAEFIPLNDSVFVGSGRSVLFTFNRNRAGVVTGLVARQRGYARPTRKIS